MTVVRKADHLAELRADWMVASMVVLTAALWAFSWVANWENSTAARRAVSTDENLAVWRVFRWVGRTVS